MLPTNRKWWAQSSATSQALAHLREAVGVSLPDEYLELLSFSNGGEGPLPVQPYNFCLDSAEVAAESWSSNAYGAFFPGFFVFGGNGGGEYIAFDLRGKQSPWPVVALDMTNDDLSESVMPIAKDFSAFIRLVGIGADDA